jgi:predicted DNA-binding protein
VPPSGILAACFHGITRPSPTWYHGDMKPAKAMSIRLSAEQAEALETVAAVDNQSIAEVIRSAITEHVESRRKDKTFRASLRDRINRTERLLKD